MTVAEAMKRLAELPPDAQLCWSAAITTAPWADTIREVSQIDLVRAYGDEDGYNVDDAGDKRIAVVA